jgi:hypothetical protein
MVTVSSLEVDISTLGIIVNAIFAFKSLAYRAVLRDVCDSAAS